MPRKGGKSQRGKVDSPESDPVDELNGDAETDGEEEETGNLSKSGLGDYSASTESDHSSVIQSSFNSGSPSPIQPSHKTVTADSPRVTRRLQKGLLFDLPIKESKKNTSFNTSDNSFSDSKVSVRFESRSVKTERKKADDKALSETKGIKFGDIGYNYLAGMGVILAILICVFYNNRQGDQSFDEHDKFEIFKADVDSLRPEFVNQDQRLWRTVKASGAHVLNVSEPEYPAVLLFITNIIPDTENNVDASSCLARKISAHFNRARKITTSTSPVIKCGNLDKTSTDKEKYDLDQKLRSYFDDGSSKAVVIDNLEKLSAHASLLLHGVCDGDNAPYKDVMIILVLHTDQRNLDHRSGERFLQAVWEEELESDKVGALLSRVANNIVIVNSEPKTLINSCS